MTMPRVLRLGREVALTLGAIAGSVCLLMLVLGAVADVRPLVFRSGSMAPEIATGDLAVVRTVPAGELEPGDVVSVVNTRGDRVTHRLVRTVPRGAGYDLTLQGDANPGPDAETYPVTEAEKVLFTVPYVGRAIAAMSSPAGLVVVGGLGVLLVGIVLRGPNGPGGATRSPKHRQHSDGPKRRPRTTVALRGAGAGLALVVASAGGAWAAPWTDAVPVTGQALKASVVPPSSNFACGGVGVLSVSFSWTAVPGATNYTLHYGTGGNLTATVTGTSRTITSAISGGTAWVVANRNFGSTTWSSVASNTRTYTVAVVSVCG